MQDDHRAAVGIASRRLFLCGLSGLHGNTVSRTLDFMTRFPDGKLGRAERLNVRFQRVRKTVVSLTSLGWRPLLSDTHVKNAVHLRDIG
jgi:hypothetical protein